jgi:hypothetical protein
MYFPYMRGKQFELLALKETAIRLKNNKVFPIIEPVKSSVKPLITTINELNQHLIYPYIIINPEIGELLGNPPIQLITTLNTANAQYIPCIRINNTNVATAVTIAAQFISDNVNFALYIQEYVPTSLNIYMQVSVVNVFKESSSYPAQFIHSVPRSVILCDSFPSKIRNADYQIAPVLTSNAHLTYNNGAAPNQIGFGDFLTIGEKWSENGGPAYVVAIHISYIDNNMYVKHCISITGNNNQYDPGGKFLEALQLLITFANNSPSINQNTLGFQAFLSLYQKSHYSGLGVSKKLSMMHHLETLSDFL